MSNTLLKLEPKLAVSFYSPIPYQLTDRCGESSDIGLVNVDRYANLFSPLRFHPNCQAVLDAEDTNGFLLERCIGQTWRLDPPLSCLCHPKSPSLF